MTCSGNFNWLLTWKSRIIQFYLQLTQLWHRHWPECGKSEQCIKCQRETSGKIIHCVINSIFVLEIIWLPYSSKLRPYTQVHAKKDNGPKKSLNLADYKKKRGLIWVHWLIFHTTHMNRTCKLCLSVKSIESTTSASIVGKRAKAIELAP